MKTTSCKEAEDSEESKAAGARLYEAAEDSY